MVFHQQWRHRQAARRLPVFQLAADSRWRQAVLVGGQVPSGLDTETCLLVAASLQNTRPPRCLRLHPVHEVLAAVTLFLRRYGPGRTSGAPLQVPVMTRGDRTAVSHITVVVVVRRWVARAPLKHLLIRHHLTVLVWHWAEHRASARRSTCRVHLKHRSPSTGNASVPCITGTSRHGGHYYHVIVIRMFFKLLCRVTLVVQITFVITARRVCIAQTMPWQDVCPSVCLSICLSHAGIESKRLHIFSKFFYHRVVVAPPF